MLRLLTCIFTVALSGTQAIGHPPVNLHSPADSYHARQLTYHRQVAQLDELTRLRRLETEALSRQLKEWEPLDRFRTGRPVMMDVEQTRLRLELAKLEHKCLEQQAFDLTHSRSRGW